MHIDKRSRHMLEGILDEWARRAEDLDDWQAVYEDDPNASWKNMTEEEKQLVRAHNEEIGRFESLVLADAIIFGLERTRHPWPTMHRLDFSSLFHECYYLEDKFEIIVPSLDGLVRDMASFIEKKKEKVVVSLEFSGSFCDSTRISDFDTSTGICSIAVSGKGSGRANASTEVCVEGLVTPLVRNAFIQAVKSILVQVRILATMAECIPGKHWLPSPRHPINGLPAEGEDDGSFFSGYTRDLDVIREARSHASITSITALPSVADAMKALESPAQEPSQTPDEDRMVYLLDRIAFRPAAHQLKTNAEKREDAVRQSLWQMAQLARIGPSMLAFIGYMAIFERCILCLKFDGKSIAAGLAETIGGKLKLPSDEQRRLALLFSIRNSAVHELRDTVRSRDVTVAWSLAKTAIHHLIAKMTKTEDWNAPRLKHGIERAVSEILSRPLLWEFDLSMGES